ncbi:MAG: diacylglyceryl transferase, partial [Flavobacteriaceae bacterium]|nr:diacylglyceryl transferase [Flavobacteriaceae bacterium]
MFENLKKKWGIESFFQLIIIFIVFAITGSVAAKMSDPITTYLNLDTLPGLFYW